MKTAMLKKMIQVVKTAMQVEEALWKNAFKTPATVATAELALANLTAKFDRITRVLFVRYGVDYRYSRATEVVEMEVV